MKKICLIIFLCLSTLSLLAQNEEAIAMRGTYTNVTKIVVSLRNGTSLTYSTEAGNLYAITFLGDHGFKVYQTESEISSDDYVYSEVLATTIVLAGGDQPIDPDPPIVIDNNTNRNTGAALTAKSSYGNQDATHAWQYEYPKLKGGASNLVIRKSTSDYGDTFALEWDCTKKANRWTCYRLDAKNSVKNIKNRTNDFKEDTDIKAAYRSKLSDYSGSDFDRGHLCPSADRRCSLDQNKQTFFLSNMQPQYHAHNGGKWNTLEEKVRTWADNLCDTLYIVKAATIDDVVLDGTTQSGIMSVKCNGTPIVPAYFYMALLAYKKSTDSFEALGIWTNHAQEAKDINIEYISIDELERRTGIDFFCNLIDEKEDAAEASFNTNYWNVSNVKSRATFDIEREMANNTPAREEIDSDFIESCFDGIRRANSQQAR